jgi:hypothetical protein
LPRHSLRMLPLMSFSMMFLLFLFIQLLRIPLRRRSHRCPPRRSHQCPHCRLHQHMHPPRLPRPCIAHVAPPAYMSLPMSGLTSMLLSMGTRRFPPPHVRR